MVYLASHSYPERMQLELTSKCNYKCITCKHGYVDYGVDINDGVLNNIIDDIMPYITELELQGTGESLLSPNFWKVFNRAQRSNCRVTLITNGSLLTDQMIDTFVRSNMQLVVSLDGTDSDEYGLHRPNGDFGRVIANLNLLSKHRNVNPNPTFSNVINMVVTQQNFRSIRNMVDIAYSYGVDFIYASEVRECMPDKRVWNNIRIDNVRDRELINGVMDDAKEYSKELGIGFKFNHYNRINQICRKTCVSPWRHLFVNANGDVSVCCELNRAFGNMHTDNFIDIWNSEKINEFRNDMILGNYNSHCLNCCLPWGLTSI